MPTTTMPTVIRPRIVSFVVNSAGAARPHTTSPQPTITPPRSPAWLAARVMAMAPRFLPAPISVATRVCPAMAMESSMFSTKFQVELTAWYAASTRVPICAARTTVATRHARNASVRTNSTSPSPALDSMAAGFGMTRASSRRAQTRAGTTSIKAMIHCAANVPRPEPSTPMPQPTTSIRSNTVFSTAPVMAANRVMPIFFNPRKMPLAA